MSNAAKYADIINLPHHVSERHPQLGKDSYAAQFSPFAALTGYDGVVSEAARFTEERALLDEQEKSILDAKLNAAAHGALKGKRTAITYFLPDGKKEGGEYVTVTGIVKKIDATKKLVVFTDGSTVPVEDIYDVREDAASEE